MNQYTSVGVTIGGQPNFRELASQHDDTFKIICQEGWSNDSSGNVEAPTGYFWLVECPDGSIDNQWQSLLENVQSELENYGQTYITPDPSWYVVIQDNQGIWFVYQALTQVGAERAFYNLCEEYNKWEGDDSEI
jgi:hypothetical protein